MMSRKRLEAHLNVLAATVELLREELLGAEPEATPRDPARTCPGCGEEENLERTDEMGGPMRITCRECGKSWLPAPEHQEELEEVSRG